MQGTAMEENIPSLDHKIKPIHKLCKGQVILGGTMWLNEGYSSSGYTTCKYVQESSNRLG